MFSPLIFERIEFLSIMSDAGLKAIPCGFLNVSFLSSSESRAIETNLNVHPISLVSGYKSNNVSCLEESG